MRDCFRRKAVARTDGPISVAQDEQQERRRPGWERRRRTRHAVAAGGHGSAIPGRE